MNNHKKKQPKDRVILITGASSGVGTACAHYFSEKHYRVYGTSRQAKFETAELSDEPFPSGFKMIPMDVCDQESVEMIGNWFLKSRVVLSPF